jgi:YD repeat-containing protein
MSRIGKSHWLLLVLVSSQVGILPVLAQTASPVVPVDNFKLTDPLEADPKTDGWQVEPRTGKLGITIPLATMPGEIPFPVSLRINCSPVMKSKNGLLGYNGLAQVIGSGNTQCPMSAEISLPGITEASGSTRYVLEDGRVVTQGDFLNLGGDILNGVLQKGTGCLTYTALVPVITAAGAFGFNLPATGNLLTSTTNPQPISVWVSNDASMVMAKTNPQSVAGPGGTTITQFTSKWVPNLESGLETLGFINDNNKLTYNANQTGEILLADKNLCRVFAFIPGYVQIPKKDGPEVCQTSTAYLPLLIKDRFNHWVTFHWSRNAVTGIVSVEVRNQRSQGFTVQMARFTPLQVGTFLSNMVIRDLARVDFVGFSAPSMLVQGGPPGPVSISSVNSPTPQIDAIYSPAPTQWIGVPTKVTIGNPSGLPSSSFQAAPGTKASNSSPAPRTWLLGYVYAGNWPAQIHFTDPQSVRSDFSMTTYGIVQPQNTALGANDANGGGTDVVSGATQVVESDQSGKSSALHTLTWTRTVSQSPLAGSAISVTHTDYWGLGESDRTETYSYGDVTNLASVQDNPTDFSNGFLTRWELTDNHYPISASVEHQSFTTETAYNISIGTGLDQKCSYLQSTKHARTGELSYQRVFKPVDFAAIQTQMATTLFSGNPWTSWTKVMDYTPHFNPQWAMLETQQAYQTETVRYSPADGTTKLSPGTYTTVNIWDKVNPPALQLMKTYVNNANLQHGSSFSYDANGRLSTQNVYHVENGTALASPSTLTIQYGDDGVTGLPTAWNTAFQDLNGTTTLQKTQGNFDNGFRPQLVTDQKNLSTSTTYDLYGRPTVIAKDGEETINIAYLDEWTTRTTQVNKITIESRDGFGRVIQTIHPDGTMTVPTYDLHGRVVQVDEYPSKQAASKGVFTNELRRQSTTAYDVLDRKTSETSFTGKRIDYAYSTDGVNDIIKQTVDPTPAPPDVVDPKRTYLNLVTITRKDPFGQVVSVTAPNGDLTSYTYDGYGNKTSVTVTSAADGSSQIRTFLYDGLSRLISKYEPETGTQLFTNFNALNKALTLTEVGTDPTSRPRIRNLVYDGLGRLRSQANASGTTIESFEYQGAYLTKSVRTIGTNNVTQTFTYDPLNNPGMRLSQETTTTAVVGQ